MVDRVAAAAGVLKVRRGHDPVSSILVVSAVFSEVYSSIVGSRPLGR